MTNLIGMALIVLSHNVTTNYITNSVHQSCLDAGCINQIEREVQTEVAPKKLCALHRAFYTIQADEKGCECIAAVYHTEKTKGCIYYHTKSVVLPEVEFETTILGTTNMPLFEITTFIPLEGNGSRGSYWNGGTYIAPFKKKNVK